MIGSRIYFDDRLLFNIQPSIQYTAFYLIYSFLQDCNFEDFVMELQKNPKETITTTCIGHHIFYFCLFTYFSLL